MTNKITLGFSPCPNDTFIFDALIHKKIDTKGLDVEVVLADVEELNQKALNGELDVTKISYNAYSKVSNNYILLNSGSALGKGCGPILVKKKQANIVHIDDARIAIPGINTTANFLLSIAYPNATNKTAFLFSDIENAILNNEVDAGLLIHENRFTYQEKGLEKIIDLGEFWETQTNSLIPLGGIAIKRNLNKKNILLFDSLLKKSVEYAFANPKSALPYIKQHAQEMEEEVMYNHINLYVNKYSIDLGKEGKKAINQMFNLAYQKGLIPKVNDNLFVTH